MKIETTTDEVARILTQGLRKELEEQIRAKLADVASAIVKEVAVKLAAQTQGKFDAYRRLGDDRVVVTLTLNNEEIEVK